MNSLLVATLCFAAVCCISSADQSSEAVAACMASHGVTEENLKDIEKSGTPPEKVICFAGCVLKEKENRVVAAKHFGDAATDEQKQNVKGCLDLIDEADDCTRGGKGLKCLMDAGIIKA